MHLGIPFLASLATQLSNQPLRDLIALERIKQIDENEAVIWLKLPDFGDQSKQMRSSLEKKLKRCIQPEKKLRFKTSQLQR